MNIEKRKIIVGISGIDPRDERLIEIVFRHSQYNPVEFELQPRLDLKGCEILLVNPMTPEGLKALGRLRTSAMQLPVVSVVPRGASPGSRYAIALDRLTLQLLPMLNRVVAEQCGPDGFESRGDLIVPRVTPHSEERESVKPEPALANVAGLAAPVSATVAVTTLAAAGPEPDAGGRRSGNLSAVPSENASVSVAGLPGLPELALDVAHVLIVDESLAARRQLSRAVESLGMLCTTAGSAEEALELCKSARFDMAFVEIVLPGMNGFRLTREMRQQYPDTPVVILSCKASPLDLLRGAMAGSSKYLAKPVKMFWFRKALEEGLRRSLLARQAGMPASEETDRTIGLSATPDSLPMSTAASTEPRRLATPV